MKRKLSTEDTPYLGKVRLHPRFLEADREVARLEKLAADCEEELVHTAARGGGGTHYDVQADAAVLLGGGELEEVTRETPRREVLVRQMHAAKRAVDIARAKRAEVRVELESELWPNHAPRAREVVDEAIAAAEAFKKALEEEAAFFEQSHGLGFSDCCRRPCEQQMPIELRYLHGGNGMHSLDWYLSTRYAMRSDEKQRKVG